jgi:hypothetical protein
LDKAKQATNQASIASKDPQNFGVKLDHPDYLRPKRHFKPCDEHRNSDFE